MRELTKQYREYLGSLQWHFTREAALSRAQHKCQRCGKLKDLEVHHKHYGTFGREQPDDLTVLCIRCHDEADEQRRRQSHRKKGIVTYAEKKYGEDWQSMVDWEVLAEEFEDWRERRADA